MTNFDLTRNIAYENKIVYDYGKTQIYKSDITSPANNTPFSVPFYNNRNGEPNISYIDNIGISDKRYDSIKIYVYKLIHNNIQSLTIDQNSIIGELVVEHTNTNDPSDKLYICFLLKHVPDNTDENDIDILLNFTNKTVSQTFIELNDIIPQQDNCIVYESNPLNGKISNTVCIFTTPIEINATSKSIIRNCPIDTSLFGKKSSKYQVLPSTNITKRGDEDIYIDCSPTGESQETINTYNIPINSELSSNQEKADNMNMVVNFATFSMYSLLIAIILPPLYKATAIKSALMATTVVPNGLRLRSIDSIIVLLMTISIVTLFALGYSTIGFITMYTTIMGGLLLYAYKQNPDYITIGKNTIEYSKDRQFTIDDITNSFVNLLKNMKEIMVDNERLGWGQAFYILTIISWAILVSIIVTTYKESDTGTTVWQGFLIALAAPVGISLFLSILRVYATKNDEIK